MNRNKEQSWLRRNLKWVIGGGIGCFGVAAVCVGFFVLIFFAVFGTIKSSDVYQTALSRAQESPVVIEALGSPIEDGFVPSGSINISGPSGNADLAIPISGPKGKGTIYAVARRSAGRWDFTLLEVGVESTGQRIDLLAEG